MNHAETFRLGLYNYREEFLHNPIHDKETNWTEQEDEETASGPLGLEWRNEDNRGEFWYAYVDGDEFPVMVVFWADEDRWYVQGENTFESVFPESDPYPTRGKAIEAGNGQWVEHFKRYTKAA